MEGAKKSTMLFKQIGETTDPATEKRLRAELAQSLKDEAMTAEGDMYSGTDNAGAMRRGEEARADLAVAKRGVSAAAPAAGGVPSDFPYGFIPQLTEMMRKASGDMKLNPTMSEIVAWWEPRKDQINIQPSQQKFKDTKDYTIPGGVSRISGNQ